MYIVAFDNESPYKDLQSAIDGMKKSLEVGEQTLLVWIYNGRPLCRYIAIKTDTLRYIGTKTEPFIELHLIG